MVQDKSMSAAVRPSNDTADIAFPAAQTRDTTDRWLMASFEHDKRARFIIGFDNVLRLANRKGRDLIEAGKLSLGRDGQFQFVSSRSQRAFADAISAAHVTVNEWHHKVMQLLDSEWSALHIRVVERPSAYIEIVVNHPDAGAGLDIAPVADAFGLTSMESKVLQGLTQAACPKTIANSNNISVHTVRAHIRGIYAKMGTHNVATTQSLVLGLVS